MVKREELRLERIAWLKKYQQTTKAEYNDLLKIAMNRWGVSFRTAKEYLFAFMDNVVTEADIPFDIDRITTRIATGVPE